MNIIPFIVGITLVFAIYGGDNLAMASHHMEQEDPDNEGLHHIPYKGLCAPGFTSLDGMCVLNDRCGPGAHPGKVCVIDGKEQPYLRPSQQGGAGISTDNVICAEPLQLIFKYDASPACVKPESVGKLENRGWYVEKPSIACTLQYDPVCGVDGKTYGNTCQLGAEHLAMKHKGECTDTKMSTKGVFEDTWQYTQRAPMIDESKGYFVTEIADDIFWLVGSGYQTMFVTTGQGVVTVDAPQPIGQKYLEAINEVTSEPITHMIYSHHHADHTGAAGQIFPADITYVSHKETADVLAEENDPNRPVPDVTFAGNMHAISVGEKTLELYHLGNFHSNGDILILAPEERVAILVDLLRPNTEPYRAFGVTPDIDLYIETHDTLQDFDFDVLVSGHTGILATKDHIAENKQFTLDVMENAEMALQNSPESAVKTCVDITTERWQERLDLGQFMSDHCQAMVDHLESD